MNIKRRVERNWSIEHWIKVEYWTNSWTWNTELNKNNMNWILLHFACHTSSPVSCMKVSDISNIFIFDVRSNLKSDNLWRFLLYIHFTSLSCSKEVYNASLIWRDELFTLYLGDSTTMYKSTEDLRDKTDKIVPFLSGCQRLSQE